MLAGGGCSAWTRRRGLTVPPALPGIDAAFRGFAPHYILWVGHEEPRTMQTCALKAWQAMCR